MGHGTTQGRKLSPMPLAQPDPIKQLLSSLINVTLIFMLPFKLVYSDDYYLPLGEHVFPAQKYRLIHKRLLETGAAEPDDFVAPQPASDDDIRLVHTREYVQKLKTGTLSALEE